MPEADIFEQSWEDALSGAPESMVSAMRMLRTRTEGQLTAALSLVAAVASSEETPAPATGEASETLIETTSEIVIRRLLPFLNAEAASMIMQEINVAFGGTVNIDQSLLLDGSMMKWDATAEEWVQVDTAAQEVVIDMEYDVGTNKFNKNTMTVTVINPGSASGMTQITGGQLVEET